MLSIVTVASSTRMPTASARPPRVMMLSVSPIADSAAMAPSTDSGIEVVTIRVERQLPRNSRIIRLVADRLDFKRVGQRRLDDRQHLLDAADDVERRSGAVLEHAEQHRTIAVDV